MGFWVFEVCLIHGQPSLYSLILGLDYSSPIDGAAVNGLATWLGSGNPRSLHLHIPVLP